MYTEYMSRLYGIGALDSLGIRQLTAPPTHIGGAHRVFYLVTRADAIYVLHAFEKKTQRTSSHDLQIGRDRFRALGKLRQQHGEEKRS